MATRVVITDAATSRDATMDLEPRLQMSEIVTRCRLYFSKPEGAYALRSGDRMLAKDATVAELGLVDGARLDFLLASDGGAPVISLVGPTGKALQVAGEATLGKKEMDALFPAGFDDGPISRAHLSFQIVGGQVQVKDGGPSGPSTNGTLLNGREIRGQGWLSVAKGDKLRLAGKLELTVNVAKLS